MTRKILAAIPGVLLAWAFGYLAGKTVADRWHAQHPCPTATFRMYFETMDCVFDGATVANDTVTMSSETPGLCHDEGKANQHPERVTVGTVCCTSAGGVQSVMIGKLNAR
jgi:hypothetical protein